MALQVSTACRRPLQPVAHCKQVLGTDGVFLDEGLQRVHGAVTANSLMGYFVADNVFREFLEKIDKGFGFLGESAGYAARVKRTKVLKWCVLRHRRKNALLRAESSHAAGDGPPKALSLDSRPEAPLRRSERIRLRSVRQTVRMREALMQSDADSRRGSEAAGSGAPIIPVAATDNGILRRSPKRWRCGTFKCETLQMAGHSTSGSSTDLRVLPCGADFRWVREAGAMWSHDPNDTERILLLSDVSSPDNRLASVREAWAMWSEDPNKTERLMLVYEMLDVLSERSSSPTSACTSTSSSCSCSDTEDHQ